MTEPDAPLSDRAKRRRRKARRTQERADPFFQAFRDALGGDPAAAEIARALVRQGITTPEELRRTPVAELVTLPGLNRTTRQRVTTLRQQLISVNP